MVQVARRASGQSGKSIRATPVVAQACKVELNVLEATGTIRLKTLDRPSENPQHQVIDGRRRRLVSVDGSDSTPEEIIQTVVDERVVLGMLACCVLNQQGADDLQETVLALTQHDGGDLRPEFGRIVIEFTEP